MKISKIVGGTKIYVECAEAQRAAAEWLLAQVGRLSSEGLVVKTGAVIGFGWIRLMFVKNGDAVSIAEEDGDKQRLDITRALQVQGLQLSLPASLGLEPELSTSQQRVHVARNAWNAASVVISRFRARTGQDSGWSVLEKGAEASAIDNVTIADVADRRAEWAQAFALPGGYVVEMDGETVVALGRPQ